MTSTMITKNNKKIKNNNKDNDDNENINKNDDFWYKKFINNLFIFYIKKSKIVKNIWLYI